MFYKYIILISVLVIPLVRDQKLKSQAGIKGQINIDTTIWSSVAYLSLIPDFDNMYSISYEMIIDKSVIDSSGRFSFNTKYLPDEDNLYRIHISKKGDPPATLIIGGKDENHFFIIANNKSSLVIKDTCESEFTKNIVIEGYWTNGLMQEIDRISGYLDSIDYNVPNGKPELIRNSIFSQLRQIADTCSNPLVSLYAIYKSRFERNYSQNQQFYKNYLAKWQGEQSSYFDEFRKKIPVSNNNIILPALIGSLIIIISFFIFFAAFKLHKKKRNILKDLSVQERKIYALILEGKSNKEISDILMISLSTVKSHVNNIYSKLDVNSRKDILNLNVNE
jgi:DNA-binding CsgD family transcriptional regulator